MPIIYQSFSSSNHRCDPNDVNIAIAATLRRDMESEDGLHYYIP